MENKKIKILYIFNEGRKNKISNPEKYSNDFYYFYHHFKNEDFYVEFIEIAQKHTVAKIHPKYLLEKITRKITGKSFYGTKLLNHENKEKILSADHIIFTSESALYSSLFFIFWKNKKIKAKLTGFFMGITEVEKSFIKKFLNDFLNKKIFFLLDNILFLSENEKTLASKKYFEFSFKMQYFPFTIDRTFWKTDEINLKNNSEILFIGNDRNRDYEFLKKLVKKMQNFHFTIISKNELLENFSAPNMKIIKGEWRDSKISDLDLLNIYKKAKICIIPLLNSIQPSGQSVAMQSMSLGIPVFITKSKGFWDKKNFKDNENIKFFDKNNLEIWEKEINYFFNNYEDIDFISKNAQELLANFYDQDIYFKKLKNIMFN